MNIRRIDLDIAIERIWCLNLWVVRYDKHVHVLYLLYSYSYINHIYLYHLTNNSRVHKDFKQTYYTYSIWRNKPVGDISDTEVVDIPGEDSSMCVLDSVTLDNRQPTRFSKRKASPLYKTVAKRTTPSCSSTNISKSTQSPSQLLLDAFKDPKFLSSITSLIHSMITPTIEKAIETAVEQIQMNVLDPLMESNNELKEIIESQNSTIAEQQASMADRSRLLEAKTKSIFNFEHGVQNLELEAKSPKMASNDSEQYGRQNSIRISNFKVINKLTESELKTPIISFFNNTMGECNTILCADTLYRHLG